MISFKDDDFYILNSMLFILELDLLSLLIVILSAIGFQVTLWVQRNGVSIFKLG